MLPAAWCLSLSWPLLYPKGLTQVVEKSARSYFYVTQRYLQWLRGIEDALYGLQ